MPDIRPPLISAEALDRALAVRDLTDPAHGPHAMQLLLDRIHGALADRWGCAVEVHRGPAVVSVAGNYDRLRYPPDGAARDARYTRYVTPHSVLRTQMSAMIPPRLCAYAARGAAPDDLLIICPGVVYRRDAIDRLHTGEPHQADLWRVTKRPAWRGNRKDQLDEHDLHEMIATVVQAALPAARWRAVPTQHPYTLGGLQVDVQTPDEWVEIGECGLAHPEILSDAGLDASSTSGLAMGLGLDRLLMLVKGCDDIRLLRSTDPRVASQMLDLTAYRPVSNQPAIRRDLSIAVSGDCSAEELGDRVRSALGARSASLEAVEVLSETPGSVLPRLAVARLGLREGQKNVLIRLTIRDLERTLNHTEANEIRDAVYAALHEGSVWMWAGMLTVDRYGGP